MGAIMFKYFVLSLCLLTVIFPQQKRALTFEDLWTMKRITSFDLNQQSNRLVFSVTSYDFEKNKGNSDIYIMDADGGNFKKLTDSEKNETLPKFTGTGNLVSFLRDGQIFTIDPETRIENQLTGFYSDINEYEWSRDGKKILFSSSVFPDCIDQDCNKRKDDSLANSKVKAQIFNKLMFRHWNEWRGDKRSHLFLFDTESKTAADIYPDIQNDIPTLALGSSNDFSFSPAGDEIAFTSNPDINEATSTNNEVFVIKANNSLSKPVVISESAGNDNEPVYSPSGRYIAYCSMSRAGFEADKQNIVIYDKATGQRDIITENADFSANGLVWSPDSKFIYFTAANEINNSIIRVSVETKVLEVLLKQRVNSNLKISPDGKLVYFLQQKSTQPDEIFTLNTETLRISQITAMNTQLISEIEMNETETFWCTGAEATQVQSIIVKPPFFNKSAKYPMIFLIHGGPQGHWTDDFHYRWNLQMFASKGYVVVAPNPRGSIGYGQRFTDEISQDWGGKVYTDLMNCYDYAVRNFEFIDSNKTYAAGASYGGYMINWIAGHTDRFKALVCHAGVFNLESMTGVTEELWFPLWENGGTYWDNPENYKKWSPHNYVNNFKTPMLVVHGANDFRVPEGQAFELFTALQLKGIESRLLYYPDEYHFVVKPQNAKLWWETVFNWFNKF